MKDKLAIIPVLLLILVSSCGKKDQKQYSNWSVNGQKFSTNNVEVTIGKAICALDCKDLKNNYSIVFNMGYSLPKSGEFDLNTSTPGQLCAIVFYYNGIFYYSTPNKIGKLYASEVNKKARYTLPPTWFVNYDSPTTDSVTISGEFNEP